MLLIPKIATISSTNLEGKGVNLITDVDAHRFSPVILSHQSSKHQSPLHHSNHKMIDTRSLNVSPSIHSIASGLPMTPIVNKLKITQSKKLIEQTFNIYIPRQKDFDRHLSKTMAIEEEAESPAVLNQKRFSDDNGTFDSPVSSSKRAFHTEE